MNYFRIYFWGVLHLIFLLPLISCRFVENDKSDADERSKTGNVSGEPQGQSQPTPLPPPVGSPAITEKQLWKLAAGPAHVCAVGKLGVRCWRTGSPSEDNVTRVPITLKNPREVSVAEMNACAIDDNGVSCWGQNDRGQTAVPTLANPRMVSTGTFHSCALSDSGVSCWGSNEFGQTAVPPLVMPTNVSAGETHSCAIDENKVVCWGGAPGLVDFSDLPVVGQVTQMDRGDCALTDGVLKCWPQDKYSQVNENLQGITSISRSNGYACATGNELFKDRNGNKTTGAVKAYCTGNAEPGTTEVPAGLRNPRSIAAGASFACVIEHDDDKVVCWGKDVTNGGFKVPDDVPHR